jgi:hypothetical protein
MGMFKDMKGAFDVIRSDELKELKKKADAQPKTSMLDGVKMANQAMDSAQEMQASMNQSGLTANPMANMATMAGGLMGTATVTAINETGTEMNGAPVVELDLSVTVGGGEPYPVKHRQLIAHSALPNFQPGKSFSVRVDQNDPAKLIIG